LFIRSDSLYSATKSGYEVDLTCIGAWVLSIWRSAEFIQLVMWDDI